MRTVIKFAGALLEDDATMRALARQVVALAQEGHEILVVHGGGRLFTNTLQRMGIESKFINGLRITDREARDVAVMVFAGLLNKRLAAAISAEGQPAVGISAADAQCFVAEPMMHNEVEGGLGFVGYLTGLNNSFLESLWNGGFIPVASCLGMGPDNELYNINADHMAAACAEYLNADQLIYLTDVAGVLDGEKVLSVVTCEEVERLVQCRVVSGGMVLKLEAAKRAIEGGVRQVRIVGGTCADALTLASHAKDGLIADAPATIPGTRVLREPPLSAAQTALSAA
ncbi:MAG: acetylglutamate kinase [Candidatus Acidiferrum sp.]